jgi:hypothetical protein
MKRIVALAIPLFILALPAPTHAAFYGPIVPAECKCDNQTVEGTGAKITTAPDYGCVLQVIQNVINVMVTLATILMVFYIVIAGFQFMLSGTGGEALSKAKTRVTNVAIGILVVLVAWLLVDFVMKTIYDEGSSTTTVKFGPWNSILASNGNDRCIVARTPEGLTTGFIEITSTAPGGGTETAGPVVGEAGGCNPLSNSQLVSIDSNGHKLVPDAAQRFKAMKAAAAKDGIQLIVSSAYRSPDEQLAAWNNNGCKLVSGRAVCRVRTAAVPCSLGGNGSNHTRGTAVDIHFSGGEYTWLKGHAGEFGFFNKLPNDLNHWSDTGR